MTTQDNTPSMRSPKNKFRATINYSKALPALGSCETYGAMTMEQMRAIVINHYATRRSNHPDITARVVVMENKVTYPSFDWQQVAVWELGRKGGAREGAGRPSEALTPASFRLPADVLDKIARVADDEGISKGKALAKMVRAFTPDGKA